MGEMVRLQKYIAMCGAASRRHAEQMIVDGRVKVDGRVITELGTKVEIGASRVSLDDTVLHIAAQKYYIMLNKPYGYICAVKDQFERPTVIDLIKEELDASLYPVGRLDYDTEGLLLLTNDGDFAYHVTHPKYNIVKTYICVLRGGIAVRDLTALRRGVRIDGRLTAPAEVELLDNKIPGQSVVQISIHEGRNRQVRKMFEALGYRVKALRRIAIGPVILGNLPTGRWRHLTAHEVSCLTRGLKGERKHAGDKN